MCGRSDSRYSELSLRQDHGPGSSAQRPCPPYREGRDRAVSMETSKCRVDTLQSRGEQQRALMVSTLQCGEHMGSLLLRAPSPLAPGTQAGAPNDAGWSPRGRRLEPPRAGLVASGRTSQWRRGLQEQRSGGSVGASRSRVGLPCPELTILEQRGLRNGALVNVGQAAEDRQTSLHASWRPGRSP